MAVIGHSISLVVGLPGDAKSKRQMNELNKKHGAEKDEALPLIHGFTVAVPEDQLDSYLAALPANATVMRNTPFLPQVPSQEAARRSSGVGNDGKGMAPSDDEDLPLAETPSQGPLPSATHPLGWQEVHDQGIDGRGVTIAVIDSGLFPHQDFGSRIKAFKNFGWQGGAAAHDDYGHGTHVAGIAGGRGEQFEGVAPGVEFVGARINNPSEAIKAIDWVIANKEQYGIDVLNLSLGSDALLPSHSDPFAQATQRAIEAGILTVVAAGNECKADVCAGTISTPGILEQAITVGAYNSGQTEELEDDTLWGHSSRGPTKPDGLAKPDLVAPGVAVLSTSATNSEVRKSRPAWEMYHLDSGTSMASPMVGGALALMLQVYPGLTQQVAKDILRETAIPLDGVDSYAQGAGRMNLAAAIAEAKLRATA